MSFSPLIKMFWHLTDLKVSLDTISRNVLFVQKQVLVTVLLWVSQGPPGKLAAVPQLWLALALQGLPLWLQFS